MCAPPYLDVWNYVFSPVDRNITGSPPEPAKGARSVSHRRIKFFGCTPTLARACLRQPSTYVTLPSNGCCLWRRHERTLFSVDAFGDSSLASRPLPAVIKFSRRRIPSIAAVRFAYHTPSLLCGIVPLVALLLFLELVRPPSSLVVWKPWNEMVT